jgi:hypothetical protein
MAFLLRLSVPITSTFLQIVGDSDINKFDAKIPGIIKDSIIYHLTKFKLSF